MGTTGRKGGRSKRSRRNRRLRRRMRIIAVGTIWGLIAICIVSAVVILYGVVFEKNRAIHVNGSKTSKSNYESISNEELESFKKLYDSGEGRNNYTVCLDAGHGGSDVGAERSNGNYEKNETLKLTRMIKQYLEAVGINVVMTREKDEYISLEERKNIAENCNADLLLSIHRNVYEGMEEVNGIEAWINNSRQQSDTDMAESIINGILNYEPSLNSRGVKWGTMDNQNENYAVNKVSMTSLILEVGFMTSDTDNWYFDNKLEEMAKGIAEGILQNIGYTKSKYASDDFIKNS